MDAIRLLLDDHVTLKNLFSELGDTSERATATRTELFARFKAELTAHETIEEELLYPALQRHPPAEVIVAEGYEEHHVADLLLDELEALAVDDDTWEPKLHVLKENIEHHIREEENEMFVHARRFFRPEQLEELGASMESMKAEMLEAAGQETGRGRIEDA